MRKYAKEFFKRGLMFAGFGPVVVGIILFIISLFTEVSLSGYEILLAIISTYLLAFVQAGATIFNQIEGWSIPKSLGFHLGSIYLAYLGCYLINSWIPFDLVVVLIFTVVFVFTFLLIWLIVYLAVKHTTKKLNSKL